MAAAPQKDHAKVHVEDSSFHRTQRLRLSDLPQDVRELTGLTREGSFRLTRRSLQLHSGNAK